MKEALIMRNTKIEEENNAIEVERMNEKWGVHSANLFCLCEFLNLCNYFVSRLKFEY